jgi:hypothetical protein
MGSENVRALVPTEKINATVGGKLFRLAALCKKISPKCRPGDLPVQFASTKPREVSSASSEYDALKQDVNNV